MASWPGRNLHSVGKPLANFYPSIFPWSFTVMHLLILNLPNNDALIEETLLSEHTWQWNKEFSPQDQAGWTLSSCPACQASSVLGPECQVCLWPSALWCCPGGQTHPAGWWAPAWCAAPRCPLQPHHQNEHLERRHLSFRGRGSSRPWTQRCHSGCNKGHLGKWFWNAYKYLWWVKKVWWVTKSVSAKGPPFPYLTGQAAGIYPCSLFVLSLPQPKSSFSPIYVKTVLLSKDPSTLFWEKITCSGSNKDVKCCPKAEGGLVNNTFLQTKYRHSSLKFE